VGTKLQVAILQATETANPSREIIARARSDVEVDHLTSLGANVVIMGEREIAPGMIEKLAPPTTLEDVRDAAR
jgi:CPA2 family monovalent cation:H+ antiporter-2